MTDYRYDHMAPNLGYPGYDNYNPIATNRLGMDQQPNGYPVNPPPQHRMMNSVYMPNKEYMRPNHYDNSMYLQENNKRNDYPMLMNLSKSTPMPPNSVNYGFQPMITRAPGMPAMESQDTMAHSNLLFNQEGTPSEWNRPSPVTPSTKYRSTVKVIPTPDPIKSSRMATYAFSFEELEMKESMDSLYKLPPVLHKHLYPANAVNTALPMRTILSRPTLSVAQLHSLDTKVLLYIFYSMTRDCLQLLACEELYQRNYVYNKTNQIWYKREMSGNYSVVVGKERFDVNTWSFVTCNELLRSSDLLSSNEVNEFIKKLQ